MSDAGAARTWAPLVPKERRILGVLIEKQKTTPDGYPMSLTAIVTGCNQKSNRDPLTNYDADDVEEVLQELRHKGAVLLYEGTGRVPKWKHTLYEWLGLKNRPAELAILAELMLRGPQTVGELRGRASRMDNISDMDTLEGMLRDLEEMGLVVFLSPPGQKRGVVVTHGLYPPDELERVRQNTQGMAFQDEDGPERGREARGGGGGGVRAEIEELRTELRGLREEVTALKAEVHELREALGA